MYPVLTLDLPYCVESSALPAKLPTLSEIECSKEVIRKRTGCIIAVVQQHFIVKYGRYVDPLETQTMIYLFENSSVPVPQVYSVFRNTATDGAEKVYIIMERIQGCDLLTLWPNLSQAQKGSISLKLKNIFTEMRSLPSPSTVRPYCSVGNGPLPDGLFSTEDYEDYNGPRISGPFITEEDFNTALVARLKIEQRPQNRISFFETLAYPHIFRDHPPIFTHGDFQRKNIMLKITQAHDVNGNDTDKDYERFLIDWEFAGWYPSHWDYCTAIRACGRWEDDWSVYIHKILDLYYTEYAWMQLLWTELFTG